MTAQIRIGQELVKPKAINVFKDGEWQKQKMGYVYYQGTWTPFIEYMRVLYDNGNENVSFSKGYEDRGIGAYFRKLVGSLTLGSNYLEIGKVVAATDLPIDVTNFSNMSIEWESSATYSQAVTSSFGLLANRKDNNNEALVYSGFSRQEIRRRVDTLDISDITGDVFPYFSAYSMSNGGTVVVRCFKIWLH